MNKPKILLAYALTFSLYAAAQPPCATKNDFTFSRSVCSPLTVSFLTSSTGYNSITWQFGNSLTASATNNPSTTYTTLGNYTVKMIQDYGSCIDTVTKIITVDLVSDVQFIQTNDTTICSGASKQLLSNSAGSLSLCWTPAAGLSSTSTANPIATPTQTTVYYLNSESTGNNLITNGNFSAGNTGFTSSYTYVANNTTEGEYFVGTNPQAWNPSVSNCPDHTSGTGNMMLVNGAPTPNVKIWSQTITVTPNTNYAFATWIQAIYPVNPAQLQFSINGNNIGTLITASLPTCTWTRFYTTWNSGTSTLAAISIVNRNTLVQGNDFALDDITFSPLFLKTDSVRITIESPQVITNNSTSICTGSSLQLNTTGGQLYSWTPSAGLSNASIGNPIATPVSTTQYIVTGTTANNCSAKDTVTITVNPKPVIQKSPDLTICQGTSTQLSASGGVTYSWTPTSTLNNPSIANPVATPASSVKYYVTVTDANNCSNQDSITITVSSASTKSVSGPSGVCPGDSVQLVASGGDQYQWQPSGSLSNPTIANPKASPSATTTYTVAITDLACNSVSNLTKTVTVLTLPTIRASKLNDLDCSTDQTLLAATGGISYLWTPATTLNNPGIANPTAKPVVTTLYKVKGTDATGCSNYDSVIVNVSATGKGLYLMPTGFTPNNDGKNDCYGIKGWGAISEVEFSIFNRWGQRIFFTKNPTDCWNGNVNGLEQNPGVFIYMVKAKSSCENAIFRKGSFMLIR